MYFPMKFEKFFSSFFFVGQLPVFATESSEEFYKAPKNNIIYTFLMLFYGIGASSSIFHHNA